MPFRIDTVQGLRAIAALAVFAGHIAQLENRFLADPMLGGAWVLGFGGVDLFFVISGFVMVYITWEAPRADPPTIKRFVYARATRIYPAYWLFTVLALAGYMAMPGALTRGVEELQVWRSFTLWPVALDQPILQVGWTLSHELYFYLVFAGFLALPSRWLPALLAAWGAAASTVWALAPNPAPVLRLISHPLTWEFIFGATAALLICSGRRGFARTSVAAGLAALVIAGAVLSPQDATDFPTGWGRVAAFGAPAALIVYGAVCWEADSGLRVPAALVRMGDWSYALYLSHLLVLSAGVRIWAAFVPDAGVWDNAAMLVGLTAAGIAVAAAAYRGFEQPVLTLTRRLGKTLFGARTTRTASARLASRIW